MRPIRLTLQAFGPYANHEVIDFTDALAAGIFGIYGPTGAGKTSLFDGICFALFGESAGEERQRVNLRSDYAAEDCLTEVELVFDLGDKRYVIHRIPEQTRPAKRGNGFTEQTHVAYLFNATGLNLSEITPDNRGTVIAERRIQAVSDEITTLLGYTSQQFRQIVLLPQGKFLDVLTASTDERSKLLRKLFDVSIYERLTRSLIEKEKTLREKITQKRTRHDALLEPTEFNTYDALCNGVDNAKTTLSTAQEDIKKHQAKSMEATELLQSAKIIENNFIEKETTQKDLLALEAKNAEVAEYKNQIKNARLAQKIQPHETTLTSAQKTHADAAQRQKASQERVHTTLAAHKAAQIALESEKSCEHERVGLAKYITTIDEYSEALNKTENLKVQIQKSVTEETTAQHDFNELSSTCQQNTLQLKKLQSQAEEAVKREINLVSTQAELDNIGREKEAALAHQKATSNVEESELAVKSSSHTHRSDLSCLTEATLRLDEAETALSGVQAIHLASNLNLGMACPVCGSNEHPNPATGNVASDGLNNNFLDAKKDVENATARERKSSNQLNAAQTRLSERRATLTSLSAPKRNIQEIDAAWTTINSLYETLSSEPSHTELTNEVRGLEAKNEEITPLLKMSETELHTTGTQVALAKQKLEDALANIPVGLRDTSALEVESESTKNKLETKTAALKYIEVKERQSSEDQAKAVEALKAIDNELNRETKLLDQATQAFQEELVINNIAEKKYFEFKNFIPNIDDITQRISDHEQLLAAATSHKNRANQKVQNLERPDLPLLESTERAALTAFTEIQTEATRQDTLLKSLVEVMKKLAEAKTEIKILETEYESIGNLADMMNGKNERKVQLTDFAIAAALDEILEAANLRLTPMTDGQFALHREIDATNGRKKHGLNIVVYDANTDSTRPTASLSGGEGFLAALSLALGLSDVVQSSNGGIKIDTIFIDEGFGSLDDDALDGMLRVLSGLGGQNRAVGLISHVDLVKEIIPNGFQIEGSTHGSRVYKRGMVA